MCLLQRAQTAFSAGEYGTAAYWYELVRTWDPKTVEAPLATCEAARAAPALAASASTNNPPPSAPLRRKSLWSYLKSRQGARSPMPESRLHMLHDALVRGQGVAYNIAAADIRTCVPLPVYLAFCLHLATQYRKGRAKHGADFDKEADMGPRVF